MFAIYMRVCRMGDIIMVNDTVKDPTKRRQFWLLYLACLSGPKNKWDVSRDYGFMRRDPKRDVEIPTTRLYRKEVFDEIVESEYFERPEVSDKGPKYLSMIRDERIPEWMRDYLEKEHVRKALFDIGAIKTFFFWRDGSKEDINLIIMEGERFLPTIKSFLVLWGALLGSPKWDKVAEFYSENEEALEVERKEQEKAREIIKGSASDLYEDDAPRAISYVLASFKEVFPFNVFGYWQFIKQFLEDHADEIHQLVTENLKKEPMGEFQLYFMDTWEQD